MLVMINALRNAYKILFGKPKEKISLGRLGCGMEDIIKIDLKYGMRICNGFM
jgi:hypothetical protein